MMVCLRIKDKVGKTLLKWKLHPPGKLRTASKSKEVIVMTDTVDSLRGTAHVNGEILTVIGDGGMSMVDLNNVIGWIYAPRIQINP